jgi:hypothetical protein
VSYLQTVITGSIPGGIIVPDGIIRPVVRGLALTWFINLKNHSMNYYYLIVSPLLYEIVLYCLIRLLYELLFFRLNVSSLLYDY